MPSYAAGPVGLISSSAQAINTESLVVNKAPPSPDSPRPWCGVLSVAAPLLSMCGYLGILVWSFKPIGGGNSSETTVSPGVIFTWWCGLCLMGIVAAVGAFRRRERWRGLQIAGLFGNILLFFSLALLWIINNPQGPIRSRQRERDQEYMRRQDEARERDRNNLRLRFSLVKPPGMLRLTHRAWKDDVSEYKDIGMEGSMTGPLFPKGVTAHVVWPEPRRFELTIQCDNEDIALKFDVENMPAVTATCDGEPIALPIDLPAGKRRVIIKGECP